MIKRTARFQSVLLSLYALAIVWSLPAYAADTRAISTTDNADYYGFDLRSEKDLTLDQCKSSCLGDNQCRAFTYNTKAKWCFLKSDFRQLIASEGAVAGKIVKPDGAPDIGAAPKLSFVADNLTEEARRFRTEVAATPIDENVGLQALNDGADAALRNGDPRAAMQMLTAALNIASDDSGMWSALARSILDVEPANNSEKYQLQRNANSAAVIGYDLSRSTQTRADALAVLAAALDRRELYRPALQAYEA
ncbi:hypothetical protein G3A39_42560, partial [Paraburkholderia aspalathi]|nr:hypothetical protein [Paraburkholderia aspalathi]